MAFLGKHKTSPAITTFQDKEKHCKAPSKKLILALGSFTNLNVINRLKLRLFAKNIISGFVFKIPVLTAVIIIGRVIKRQITIGIIFDGNQKIIIKINATTGVALTIANGSLRKSSINLNSAERIPRRTPKIKVKKNAARIRKKVKRKFLQKEAVLKSLIINKKTSFGKGKIKLELTSFAATNQTRIITANERKNGKYFFNILLIEKGIIWKFSTN